MLFAFFMSGCQKNTLRHQLEGTLEKQSFQLFAPTGQLPAIYRTNVPALDKQIEWLRTNATLLYRRTLGNRLYIYALAYQAPKGQIKDPNGSPLTHITHFLKTRQNYPRFQLLKVRYLKDNPLLFSWDSPLRACRGTLKTTAASK